MVYHTHSTCFGLTEQLKQLRIMPHGYGTGEMTAVERTPTCGGTVPHGNCSSSQYNMRAYPWNEGLAFTHLSFPLHAALPW